MAKVGNLGAKLIRMRCEHHLFPRTPDRHDREFTKGSVLESGHRGDGCEYGALACQRNEICARASDGEFRLG